MSIESIACQQIFSTEGPKEKNEKLRMFEGSDVVWLKYDRLALLIILARLQKPLARALSSSSRATVSSASLSNLAAWDPGFRVGHFLDAISLPGGISRCAVFV